MVRGVEKRRAEIQHMNERDGVLFEISNSTRGSCGCGVFCASTF